MRSGIRKRLDDFNISLESLYRMHKYRKNAKIRLKRMNGGYDIGQEYSNIVVPYWKKYNLKPKKYWYKIFCDREQKVNPRYIPDDLWFGKIIPYYSNQKFRRLGEDKCLHDIYFPDLHRPRTIAKNIANVFYDSEMNIISREEFIELCLKENDEFLIKPSIDSGEGRLIKFFEPEKFNATDLSNALNDLKANYICQESVKQSEILSKLNPSSLNTIRVISFLFEDEVHILSSILRVGAENAKVDNIGAGGFAIPIKNDGKLNKIGANRKSEWVDQNSRGIKFENIQIPSYDELVREIKKAHKKQAHFKIIGWDFSIDKKGTPIFIEFNSCPGQNQMTVGPTFGELTERVLEDVFIEKKYKYAQN